jgi:peptidyl-prolyl cis-trans isomerase B (cyclophilin B)
MTDLKTGFTQIFIAILGVTLVTMTARAQSNNQIEPPKKANARAAATPAPAGDPFEGASLEMMAGQCVTLDTELGAIEIAMMPENAPQATRNFLNLAATGAFDTTTFSRVVKGFVIQGGNLQTSEKWSEALAKRMSHKLPDEPGLVKHERGIVSMARTDEANSATTHFFILVAAAPHLDSKFAAFGTVTKGMEVADAINQAPVDGDKPEKPVKINRAMVSPCKK